MCCISQPLMKIIIVLVLSIFIAACASESGLPEDIAENPAIDEDTLNKEETAISEDLINQDNNLKAIYINNRKLTAQQINELTAAYGAAPRPGRYWYDSVSGSYGIWQGPSLGVLLPGHDFGSLPEDASNGDTGVFINGRELPEADAQFLEWIFAVPRQPGQWWMDAQGNIGVEGDSTPLVNFYLAYQQRTQAVSSYGSRGSGDNYWAGNFGSYGNEQNGFGYVMVDGVSVSYGD